MLFATAQARDKPGKMLSDFFLKVIGFLSENSDAVDKSRFGRQAVL